MSWEDRINSNAIDSVSIYYYNLVNKWKRYKSEIVIKLCNNTQKMVNAAKIRFVPRNFKILLNYTVGTTLPQYAIYKKQNTDKTEQKHFICTWHTTKQHFQQLYWPWQVCALPLYMGAAINRLVSNVEKHSVIFGIFMWM